MFNDVDDVDEEELLMLWWVEERLVTIYTLLSTPVVSALLVTPLERRPSYSKLRLLTNFIWRSLFKNHEIMKITRLPRHSSFSLYLLKSSYK